MEANQANPSHKETLISDSCFSNDFDWDKDLKENTSIFPCHYRSPGLCIKDEDDGYSEDRILGPRLKPTGFSQTSCKEDFVMFVNAGGGAFREEVPSIEFKPDCCFEGGNLIRTDDSIINGADPHPSISKSARSGNFSYRFQGLPPGDYLVDLHQAEIIYTNGPKGMRVFNVFLNGPKGMRVFNVFLQGEKVLSDVGANKPLQLLDARVSVGKDREIALGFVGVHGSPVVSRICIRRAPKPPDPLIDPEYLTCNNCATETPLAQRKIKTMKREQSQKVSPPAGGLIDLQSMPKKKKMKIEQKQQHHEVPIHIYLLALYLATFPSPGGLSFSAMVRKDKGSSGNSGLPPGKEKGKGSSGEKNKSLITLSWLKLKFNPKPGLDFMVLTYQWTRGCFLGTIAGRLRLNGLTLQDWMLHGLWPPENASGCDDIFNRNQILHNQEFLRDLLKNWASLKLESTNIEDHLKFWKKQWIKHGRKSRLCQQLYMELALQLHNSYKTQLEDAMNVAKQGQRASTSYDSVLGTDICTIDTCLFTTAVSQKLGAPKLKWVDLGEERFLLKEIQLKIWFCGEEFIVGDMDDIGWSPDMLIV